MFVWAGTGGILLYAFNGLFVADVMGHLLKLAAYGVVAAALAYSRQYLLDRGLLRGEYLTLLLFALLGMMVMMSANSFLSLYLGLELLSLCLYALVALNRDSAASVEAAMKYFVLGALASGLLLYGMSMIYGATGTLSITEVSRQIENLTATASTSRTLLVFGAAYTLWMVKRVIFGAVANEQVAALKDLNPREFLVLGLLAAAVLLMGVYPNPLTEVMHASVAELLRHVAQPKF